MEQLKSAVIFQKTAEYGEGHRRGEKEQDPESKVQAAGISLLTKTMEKKQKTPKTSALPPSDEREAYANCSLLQSFKIARFWLSSCRDLLHLACCCLLSLPHTQQ